MPSLTAAWARQIIAWEELPGPFRPFVSRNQPLPYLIYSPPDIWGNRKVNARLTMLSEQDITVLENRPDGVEGSRWLFDDIDYLEQGAVHLYSWLRLTGCLAGRPASVQVEYNAVVAPLFTRLMQAARRTWVGNGSARLSEEQEKLAGLAAVDYKLWSYARDSLLPGEQVRAQVFQPELVIPRLLVFRRKLMAAYVCVLADKELICIHDADSPGNCGRYGTIHRYIPLTKIKGWQLVPPVDRRPGNWRLQLTGTTVSWYVAEATQDAAANLIAWLED